MPTVAQRAKVGPSVRAQARGYSPSAHRQRAPSRSAKSPPPLRATTCEPLLKPRAGVTDISQARRRPGRSTAAA